MKRILTMAVLTMLVLCLAGCSATNKVIDSIKEGDVQTAEQIYSEKISGDFEKKYDLQDALETYLTQLYQDVNDGKVAVSDGRTAVSTAWSLSFTDGCQDILSELDWLLDSKECYENAILLLENGDDFAAYGYFDGVISEDSNYQDAQDKRTQILDDALGAVYDEIQQLMENRQFYEALDRLNIANATWGDSDFLESVRDLIYTQWQADNVAQAEQLAQAGEYQTAMDVLLEAYNTSGTEYASQEMSDAYGRIWNAWVQSVLSEAENAFGADRDYEAAIRILEENTFMGSKIEDAIAYYQGYAPVMLKDLGYTKKGKCIGIAGGTAEDRTDMNGHTYEYGYVIYPDWKQGFNEYGLDEAYVTYYLGGEYCELNAILYRPYSSLGLDDEIWENGTIAEIYADDQLIYEGPQITKNTYEEYAIQLDVTGVRELKIILASCGYVDKYYTDAPMVGIANAQVRK